MRKCAVLFFLAVLGCNGPLDLPMVERLEPESQQTVDKSWLNMLSPPERLDRSRLLDVLVTSDFHQRGVDRLNLTAEKDVWGGRVIMAVYFDRAHPAFDNYSLAFIDAQGQERRRERCTFAEVKERATSLMGPVASPSTQPATTPIEVEEQRKAEREMADRLARQILVKLATRPAGEPVEESEIMPP
jgi:hypothetical protein